LRDIPNTVLDLLGLKPPVQFPGRPLGRYWSGDRSLPSVGSEAIVSETAQLGPPAPMSYPARRGAMQSVISNNMHYIRNLGDGRQELYDLSLDPLEQHDLSATDAGRRMVEELSHALERSATGGA
jgi:arylsulfatase A-like enzyme